MMRLYVAWSNHFKKNSLSGRVEIYDSLSQGKISYGLEMKLPFCLNKTDISVPQYRFNKQKLINLGQWLL